MEARGSRLQSSLTVDIEDHLLPRRRASVGKEASSIDADVQPVAPVHAVSTHSWLAHYMCGREKEEIVSSLCLAKIAIIYQTKFAFQQQNHGSVAQWWRV